MRCARARTVRQKGQNIVMLGAVLSQASLSYKSAEEAVREVFKRKPQFVEANLSCLKAGYEFAKGLK